MNSPDDFNRDATLLQVSNIHKSFGNSPVLQDVSFDLQDKEILGIIGPSGSGKSTLLRCLNLLEVIERGVIDYPQFLRVSIHQDGAPRILSAHNVDLAVPDAVSELRRQVGLVFQGLSLWEERTVLDNLTLAPRIVLRRARAEVEEEAIELCKSYGLLDKVHSKIWRLSGGQKQRVAILRSLMMHPRILLLDEITSALDPKLTVDIMRTIQELRNNGLAMILVTHYIEFASSVCDRIMFLSEGRVIQVDAPQILRESPASEDVKLFLDVLRTAR
jgi:polar amino acid transport system ATP-binding protein